MNKVTMVTLRYTTPVIEHLILNQTVFQDNMIESTNVQLLGKIVQGLPVLEIKSVNVRYLQA